MVRRSKTGEVGKSTQLGTETNVQEFMEDDSTVNFPLKK